MEEILNSVKDIKDAKETIKNLLEIIDDMKSQSQPEESTSLYQGTNIGFVQS